MILTSPCQSLVGSTSATIPPRRWSLRLGAPKIFISFAKHHRGASSSVKEGLMNFTKKLQQITCVKSAMVRWRTLKDIKYSKTTTNGLMDGYLLF